MIKQTIECEHFNLHIFKDSVDQYSLLIAPTKNFAYPPVSKEELKNIAKFILKYLENK